MPIAFGFLEHAYGALVHGVQALVAPAVFFILLAVLLKGRSAWHAGKRALRETRINLCLYATDAVFVAVPVGFLVAAIGSTVRQLGLVVPVGWEALGTLPVLLLAIFAGDFIGYWRHRLEHTHALWPSHAIHHSDTAMTWMTLNRFHPINRLTTAAIDSTLLALMGFPAWALIANNFVRHYYGYFIHADLPWTYGPFSHVFVSPAMHRWHHARELRYAGTNFATVFSVFDRIFGTHFVPGPCAVALGIEDDPGRSTEAQLIYPLRIWAQELVARRNGRVAAQAESPAATRDQAP